jgi:YfiH family protein
MLTAAGFRHAFFTRQAGVSRGPYRSLNCSYSVGDRPGRVTENLARVAAALGLPLSRLYWLSQVHGRVVVTVHAGDAPERVRHSEGDALLTAIPGVGCGVRVADCVPLLVGERQSGMVAAVHAGWRGVVARVIEATFSALRRELGAPGDWLVAIGPHISAASFEVSEEVASALAGASRAAEVVDRSRGPKPYVDLRSIVRGQLLELGVRDQHIDPVGGCTVRDPERMFSFRRDGPRSGRHLAAIVCRGGRTAHLSSL